MPALADPRQEAFCQAIAQGASKTTAAEAAGYTPTGAANHGSRLTKRPYIKRRIGELSTPEENKQFESKTWITVEIVQTHRMARRAKQHAVSVSCLQLLAKLHGHLVERRESYAEKTVVHEMNEQQLHAYLRDRVNTLPEARRTALIEDTPELAGILEGDPGEDKADQLPQTHIMSTSDDDSK